MKRRDSFKAMAGIGLFSLLGKLDAAPAKPAKFQRMPSCVLTPQQTAGPYYIDVNQIRKDITEGKAGTPLRTTWYVVDAATCEPIPHAVVEIWHADARGAYSGFPGQGDVGNIDTSGEIYLRGAQIADGEGKAEFETVFPGWYPGRVTHIHFKISFGDNTYVTSQSYFSQDLIDQIYSNDAPYTNRGLNSTTNASDAIFVNTQGRDALVMTSSKDGDEYHASITIGIEGVPLDSGATGAVPSHYVLDQNYPNPIPGATTIGFTLPVPSDVSLVIFDLLGKKLGEVYSARQSSGTHSVQWDGTLGGERLPHGNYYYQLIVQNANGTFTQVRHLTLLRQ